MRIYDIAFRRVRSNQIRCFSSRLNDGCIADLITTYTNVVPTIQLQTPDPSRVTQQKYMSFFIRSWVGLKA
jgi:hypothetical protein